jgi:MoxR-like ATPase
VTDQDVNVQSAAASPSATADGAIGLDPTAPLLPPQAGRLAHRVLDAVERAVVGKRDVLELILSGILASGHVLIEDLPGLGKTLMARSFAAALGLSFTRIQFTPDLLPADVTGTGVYDQGTGQVAFRPGPVFTQLLLADEINRTPPKTQAALLEAMGEGQVSADGVTHTLPAPFIVLATDNPIEYEGTYPLPEAQLDRFTLRVRLGYLPRVGEVAMLRRRMERGSAPPRVPKVVDAATLLAMRESLEQVQAKEDILDYIVRLLEATRQHPQVAVGASPRGGLALLALARAHAVLAGRDFVLPEDVKALAAPALAHRLTLRPEVWVRRIDGEQIVAELLATVPTPATAPGS